MSIPLTINGVTFQYPQQFDRNWGPTLTNWSQAVTNALAPLTGGFLTLPYPSTGIAFTNATHTGTISLTLNGSNQLTFNGVPIGATTTLTNGHILVGNVSNNPTDVAMSGDVTITNTGVTSVGNVQNSVITNAMISATAAIALTKLASTTPYYWYAANSGGVLTPLGVTASRAVITDANGLPSASSVTPTELGYVSGVTSAIQTQINSISGSITQNTPSGVMVDYAGTAAPSGWLLCDGSVVSQTTYANLYTAIGANWNTGGEGAGNFRLPNMTRRIAVGSGGSATATLGNTVGSVGGEETHTLIAAELAPHSHAIIDPGHNHDENFVNTNPGTGGTSGITDDNLAKSNDRAITFVRSQVNVAAVTGITGTASAGSGAAHNNIQPSAVVTKIIKI